jgi:predicted metal-dependent phosphoesterase TrpH
MGLMLDIHVHTRRFSPCSTVDPERLINQAVRAGLDGVVLTEHGYQWDQAELDALAASSDHEGFVLLTGFEYGSSKGDLLVYGLTPDQVRETEPGLPPPEAVARFTELGGCCVAAHPTRAGHGFDETIVSLPLAGIEVASTALQPHEQQLAGRITEATGIPAVAGSDAHRIQDIGQYATEFLDVVRSASELHNALHRGRFRVRPSGTPGGVRVAGK